jgi:hypothetical protein
MLFSLLLLLVVEIEVMVFHIGWQRAREIISMLMMVMVVVVMVVVFE